MEPTLRNARVVGPVPYLKDGGKRVHIPLGPCLIEPVDGQRFDVIWGASGQRSAMLSMQDLETATSSGHLVLLEAVA